jgi:uncharacterized protein YcbK (DUF882 family)
MTIIGLDAELALFGDKKTANAGYNCSAMNSRILSGVAFSVLFALTTGSTAAVEKQEDRTLTFYHTHTDKWLTVTFAKNGDFVGSALQEANEFLGDFRTGDIRDMDPELLHILYDLRQAVGSDGAFEVISAYRSPATNKMLRERGAGVARNSQHLQGKAIDVRLRGVETAVLRDAAIGLQRGGVGYYKRADFVHVDTGRVRRW